eukprot:scaffold12151_cov40-Cyclotella_meneghiniana.AAC.4
MSPYIVPCRFIRFDREGNEIDKSTENDNEQPFLWNDLDAAALVAAVESVQRADGKYFCKVEGDEVDAEKYVVDSSPLDMAECLRLVPCMSNKHGGKQNACESKDNSTMDVDDDNDCEEEVRAIRSLIVNNILHTSNDEEQFQHPNPDYILKGAKTLEDTVHESTSSRTMARIAKRGR